MAMTTIIDKAQYEIAAGKPLIAIDTLLDAFLQIENKEDTSEQKATLIKLFSQAILRSKQVYEAQWQDDPVAGLFRNTLSEPTCRFAESITKKTCNGVVLPLRLINLLAPQYSLAEEFNKSSFLLRCILFIFNL